MKNPFFAGAGLIVTDRPLQECLPGKVTVVTPHAAALNRLILELKQEYAPFIDFLNKYEFYPALGRAAHSVPEEDEQAVLAAVRKAAREFFADCPHRPAGV